MLKRFFMSLDQSIYNIRHKLGYNITPFDMCRFPDNNYKNVANLMAAALYSKYRIAL